MSHKLDERKENIQKIKKDIENTQANAEFAEEMIESIVSEDSIKTLKDQNKRRMESVRAMTEDVIGRVQD